MQTRRRRPVRCSKTTGFVAVDLGTLDVGGPLASLPFGALATQNFVRI